MPESSDLVQPPVDVVCSDGRTFARVQLVLRKSRDGVPEDRELDVEALKAVLGIVKA
jgi:hypothetical protein